MSTKSHDDGATILGRAVISIDLPITLELCFVSS